MPRHIEASQLPEDIARIAEAEVAAGHYATVEDVVRAGVEAVQRHRQRTKAVLEALDEGERSGLAEDSSIEGVLAEFRARRAG